MYYKKLVGDKLYLSPVNPEDYKIYTKWLNDEILTSGLGTISQLISEKSEKDFLEKASADSKNFCFAIVRLEDDVLIGNYGIDTINLANKNAHVGGLIGELSERGKGYGTEALRLVTDFAFNVLGLHSLYSDIYSFNYASIKSAEKVGYKICGTKHESVFISGKFYDAHAVEILSNDFNSKNKTFVKPLPDKKD